VIVAEEIEELHRRGVARIFSPADGQQLGLEHMVNLILAESDTDLAAALPDAIDGLLAGDQLALARFITGLEAAAVPEGLLAQLEAAAARNPAPVLGITGTGGSGKSSLTDELVRRFRLDQEDKLRIAVLAIDPTRRRGGGALLGDRIRMNAIGGDQIFFRSLATRGSASEVPPPLPSVIAACRAAGFDVVIIETRASARATPPSSRSPTSPCT